MVALEEADDAEERPPCKHWARQLVDPALPPVLRPTRLLRLFSDGCTDRWRWSFRHKSPEVHLSGRGLGVASFHVNWSSGTAAARGTRALNNGRHYWEVHVSRRIFGTSMMFGVCTEGQRLHADAFVNLIGEDERGWGLSHKGTVWHAGASRPYCHFFKENQPTTVGVLYDRGTLSFYQDGHELGVAFTGLEEELQGEPVYPVVSSTAAKTEMRLGATWRGHAGLQDRCRSAVLARLKHPAQVDALPLPPPLKRFLTEPWD